MGEVTGETRKMQPIEVRRELRRSNETRTRFWHAAIVSSFFVVVVGASLFLGVVMVIGAIRGQSNELIADGRTTKVARVLNNGALCHYIVIDNRTAQAIEDRVGRCDEGKPKRKQTAPIFSWGGR